MKKSIKEKEELIFDIFTRADDLGALLRMHMLTEALLSEYLSHYLSEGRERYIQDPKYFGDKLAFAVAFNLPLPIAEVCKCLNVMRNSIAHRGAVKMSADKISNFCLIVNGLATLEPDFDGLPQGIWGSLIEMMQAEKDRPRFRFIAAFLAFYQLFDRWLQARSSLS